MIEKFLKNRNYKKFIALFMIICLIFFGHIIKSRYTKIASKSYTVYASFSNVSGLQKDAFVMVSGYQIGYVDSIVLDDNLMPRVKVKIYNNYTLPNDSSVAILTDGLLGKKYLEITPGGMEDVFNDGDEVAFTQSSIDILDIADKYLSSIKIEKK
ncbi:MAG: MlaD family protein [Rickettsiales bacterium]|jgi:phospholipid/cholesterol/gamma-HCH transport system substrate-binding protein|nr:MlaD family protein [Rickettsiales bacterium]